LAEALWRREALRPPLTDEALGAVGEPNFVPVAHGLNQGCGLTFAELTPDGRAGHWRGPLVDAVDDAVCGVIWSAKAAVLTKNAQGDEDANGHGDLHVVLVRAMAVAL